LQVDTNSAAAPARRAAALTHESAKIETTVTSHSIGLPPRQWISVRPSGQFCRCCL